MATKTNLISAINAQITAIITQAKHRLSMLHVVNEIYPDVVNETDLTVNTKTTKNLTESLAYDVSIVKQGREVTIVGYIKNNTGSIISSASGGDLFFFEIVSPEFYTNVNRTKPYFCFSETINSSVYFKFNKLYCNMIPDGETLFFDLTYFTQD